MSKINWKEPGQIVNVGWDSNITSPYWGRTSMTFYVDEHGNYFGGTESIKYNPYTGEIIKKINDDFAGMEYNEE